MKFITIHFSHLKKLEGYLPAEIIYEYLKVCQNSKFVKKDRQGFFSCASSQIERDLGYGRAKQQKAKLILKKKGWVESIVGTEERSPTLHFRIAGTEVEAVSVEMRPITERDKASARRKLKRAVVAGEVLRFPCEVCGHGEVEGHHPNYAEPLNAVWLCRTHHKEIHVKMRNGIVEKYPEYVDIL